MICSLYIVEQNTASTASHLAFRLPCNYVSYKVTQVLASMCRLPHRFSHVIWSECGGTMAP